MYRNANDQMNLSLISCSFIKNISHLYLLLYYFKYYFLDSLNVIQTYFNIEYPLIFKILYETFE